MEEHQQQEFKMPQIPKGSIKKVIWGVTLVLLIILGLNSYYTVQEQEKAAILTFGKYTSTENAGLHFKLPYIQQVVNVPANITQRMHIGYREDSTGKTTPVLEESLMITGDENIVSADAVVEWRVSNMEQYLYNIESPDEFIRNASIAAIRSVMGSTKLDYAITDGKTVVQQKVKEKLDELNEKYQTGILIQDIKFQDIEPPQGEVQQAFRDVTNAREEKNTKINNAKKYENDRIPKARGEAQALIDKADGEKQSRILNARGDVAKFNAVYSEYIKNPQVTKDRLVIETLEKILPQAKVIITDSSGGTVKYLPLNDLLNQKAAVPAAPSTTKGSEAK